MHFTLKNLGRLEEATIDLGQDLIVLTGRNNTSKTYVAHAVYGFAKQYRDVLAADLMPDLITEHHNIDGRIDVDVVQLLRENLKPILRRLGLWYKTRLPDVFAADEDFASRAEVLLDLDAKRLDERCAIYVQSPHAINAIFAPTPPCSKEAGSPIVTFSLGPEMISGKLAQSRIEQWRAQRHEALVRLARSFTPLAMAEMLLPSEPHILTAERSAIQLFSRELSLQRSDLVDELLAKGPKVASQDLTSLIGRRARRYSLPIRKELRIADDLAAITTWTSSYAPFADRLERDILEGSVRVGEAGEMRFHPEASQTSLEMHLASSSVKSLAPLSFYLRHIAWEGQLLIIDEPELNLHPDNQRHVAKLLVCLARAGLKVIISTHSDYIIREINNAIMLSADTIGALRKKYGYEEQDTIRPERVGAYLFDATRARPIPVEPTGIAVKSIDDEINRLNQSSQDIYYALFDEPKGA
jgi:AAA domain, putative AbiEii toxin, Type IV TA system